MNGVRTGRARVLLCSRARSGRATNARSRFARPGRGDSGSRSVWCRFRAALLTTLLGGLFGLFFSDLFDVDADGPLGSTRGLRPLSADLLSTLVTGTLVGVDHLHPVDVLLASEVEIVPDLVARFAGVVIARSVGQPVGEFVG